MWISALKMLSGLSYFVSRAKFMHQIQNSWSETRDVLDCKIIVREFKVQLCYCIHFRYNTLRKGLNPSLTMGLHSTQLFFCNNGFRKIYSLTNRCLLPMDWNFSTTLKLRSFFVALPVSESRNRVWLWKKVAICNGKNGLLVGRLNLYCYNTNICLRRFGAR